MAYKAEGAKASVGIAQLEIYKARFLLKQKGVEMSDDEIYDLLVNKPRAAIELAAEYMKYLKATIAYQQYVGAGQYKSVHISDGRRRSDTVDARGPPGRNSIKEP
ncbi:hypothetical protein [Nonomuraea jiangxiensis]|uniref:hypothetical protein n=1 Tax=Nonomuraea jiangxiensis TaxID=633440 RepID=UPI00115FCB94|nr:hypothetical protein [Nonomuraea jiangxiensis]